MQPYEQLEKDFGEWAQVPNVVACASGTAALHLALEALDLPKGSKVLMPDYTMIACARAVTLAGLEPIFVDCGDDLLMDPDLLRHARYPNVQAIMVVHVYGRICDMDRICAYAKAAKLPVIEDCAESHGARHRWLTAARCWSFYRNKIVHGEEGGAVSFTSPRQAAHAKQLRSLGFTEAHDYEHIPRGHNYRLSNVHAQLVRDSLCNVASEVQARRQVEALYNLYCPTDWKLPHRDAPWVYDLRVPRLIKPRQSKVIAALHKVGIAARHGFKPMSCQDEYKDHECVSKGNAYQYSREVLYLPLTPDMTESRVQLAFDTIHRSLC